jgi:hypothetical protein
MTDTKTKRHRLFGPVRLDDRGAIAVEFAILFPIVLLMIVGVFETGVLMAQYLQLQFTTESEAKVEAKAPGTGVGWASLQLPSPVTFVASAPTPTCAGLVTGTWQVSLVWVFRTCSSRRARAGRRDEARAPRIKVDQLIHFHGASARPDRSAVRLRVG